MQQVVVLAASAGPNFEECIKAGDAVLSEMDADQFYSFCKSKDELKDKVFKFCASPGMLYASGFFRGYPSWAGTEMER